jgi:hypothetical protein
MSSQLRVNTITSTTGVGTVTLGSGGVSFSGTPTFNDITLSSINSGPLAGARNCIINGNFDIWQRGTTSTVTTAGSNYLTDRYIWNTQGNTTTVSRQAFTVGQTDVPYEPTYFHRIQITAAVAAQLSLEQRVEDVRTLAGQTATLSFYAKGAAAFTLNYSVAQNFGTGGSPSSGVSAGSGTVSLTTSWQKFTITFNVPSISGKTLGTNNDHFLQVVWQMPASATNTFDLAQVQLEKGSVATPFERRSYGQELALCQRYCHKWSANGDGTNLYSRFPMGIWGSTTQITVPFSHPVSMRTVTKTVSSNTSAVNVYSQGLTFNSGVTFGVNTDANTLDTTFVNVGGLSGGTGNALAAARFLGDGNAYILFTTEL